MDNTNFGWVKACKGDNLLQDLLEHYKKHYLPCKEEDAYPAIASILSGVVDDVAPMSISKWLRDYASPYTSELPYYKLVSYVLGHHLRFTNVSRIVGYKEWLEVNNEN